MLQCTELGADKAKSETPGNRRGHLCSSHRGHKPSRSHRRRTAHRRQTTYRRPLSPAETAAAKLLGAQLQPAAPGHPWPRRVKSTALDQFDADKGEAKLTLVEPLVVEVSADTAMTGTSFRHTIRYLRTHPELRRMSFRRPLLSLDRQLWVPRCAAGRGTGARRGWGRKSPDSGVLITSIPVNWSSGSRLEPIFACRSSKNLSPKNQSPETPRFWGTRRTPSVDRR
jgi:hypothetical protein